VSTEHWCQEAVMCALRVSATAAQTRLKTARTLTDELPRTLAAVLQRAAEQSLPELRRSIKRAALRVDPATAETRHQQARQDRCVRKTALADGMAELRLIPTAEHLETAWLRLDAGVRLLPAEDDRTRDQQRADLLVDAILTGIPHDALPELQGRRPSIQVVVSADTLLSLDDEPGHLTGHGAITADTARRLAAEKDATWLARDSVCSFPSCNQPGYLCDLDHSTPWDQGGHTCPGNNRPGCRRHHNCKTHTVWIYVVNVDGSFTQQSAQRALDLAQDRRRHQLHTREDPDHIPF
jgi:hypothetical protein